jgi:CheY-like chemotaxis protein
MTFAREDRLSTAPVDINAILTEALGLARVTLPESVRIEQSLGQDLPPVLGDANQLNQVMLNLVNNARDAMPSGGILRVSTHCVDGVTARSIYKNASADEYLHLVISDEGEGMSEETRSRMFEPFFTTKGVGKGSGLGLAVVYGVVHGHDGFINVVSRPYEGTEFHVYLPASRGSVAATPIPDHVADKQGKSETVLVIEDEPMLLDLLQVLLETNGYRVLTAADGEQALKVYQENLKEISVVLSDMGLPKIGGWEVFQRMKELNPSVRSILASGYLDQHLRSDLIDAGAKDFIQKPYIPDQILKRIREVISEPEPS